LKPTFTESTAEMLGVSQRSIQQEVAISERISPEVKAKLENTAIADRKADLMIMSKQTPEVQAKIADKFISGEITKIAEYFDDEPEPEIDSQDEPKF
jgi:hypothetical protein